MQFVTSAVSYVLCGENDNTLILIVPEPLFIRLILLIPLSAITVLSNCKSLAGVLTTTLYVYVLLLVATDIMLEPLSPTNPFTLN